MKMVFTYEDFKEKYLYNPKMMPRKPLDPVSILDFTKYGKAISEYRIDKRIRTAFSALEKRMGKLYFNRFESVQTRVKDYSTDYFPAYKLLFLDITCEDWLSLVDFHKGFSRDHSVHQPLTAYIVSKILGLGKSEDAFKISGVSILDKALDVLIDGTKTQYLRTRLQQFDPDSPLLKTKDRDTWRAVFYQVAIITAMYHDIGYPWQFMDKMHEYLNDVGLLCGRLLEDSQQVDEYVDEHKDELMLRPFYFQAEDGSRIFNKVLFEKCLHNTHGLPGALAYAFYNLEYQDKVISQKTGLIKFCQEWSCLAIMMHDMSKVYSKSKELFPRLDFDNDPLSFIIALADTLEDFNRPNASFVPNEKGCVIEYSFPSLSVELEENNGDAIICYKVDSDPKTVSKQNELKAEDQELLFDQPEGFFNLSSIGLSTLTIMCKP